MTPELHFLTNPPLPNPLAEEFDGGLFWTIWTFKGCAVVMMDRLFGFTLTNREQ